MKLNYLIISVFILFFVFPYERVISATFSEKDKSVIYTNVFNVLNQYQDFIIRIGEESIKTGETPSQLIEQFNDIFLNRKVFIFNDLDPKNELSEFYEVETYSANLALWYKDGMKVALDLKNTKVGEIIQHGPDVFYLDIYVSKHIEGNFQNRILNIKTVDLAVRIAFLLENKQFKDFKIVGIRDANSPTQINDQQILEEFKSAELTDIDLSNIHESAKELLSDYSRALLSIGNPDEPSEDKKYYIEDFKNFFPDSSNKIFNDLEPEPEQTFLDVNTYLSKYIEYYPEGVRNISLNIDSIEFGEVVEIVENKYFMYTYVRKFFSGNYQQKRIFRYAIDLIFKISFERVDQDFDNFQIMDIDRDIIDFYEEDSDIRIDHKNLNTFLKPVSRKGFGFEVNAGYGITEIKDKNLIDLNAEENNHSWTKLPEYNYIVGIGIDYFFNNHLGIGLGVDFSEASTNYSLDGRFQDSELSTDINGDQFYKIIDASYDSLLMIRDISLPLKVMITSNMPKKFSWYLNLGIRFSYAIESKYETEGFYHYSGYYPDHPAIIQYIDFQELGYYSRDNIQNFGDLEISRFNISGYVSTGLIIPVGYFKDIYIGPFMNYGINDYSGGSNEYTDIFGKTYPHESLKINFYGINLGVHFKL